MANKQNYTRWEIAMLKSHSRSSRRPLLLIIGLLAGGCLLVLGLMTWVGFNLLAGTSLAEGQLTPAQQLKWLNDYSPQPVPASAGAIKLSYHQFTDWYFEADFALPASDFQRYVEQLRPADGSEGTFIGACQPYGSMPAVTKSVLNHYKGTCVGGYEGLIVADPTTLHIHIIHRST